MVIGAYYTATCWYELKCNHSGSRRYSAGPASTKAAEFRAQALRGIAKSKVHAADAAYHRVTAVHAGKAMSRFLLPRLRFAHPHRNTPQCPERAMQNVNDVVGYDVPRTLTFPAPPCCVALGPRLSASPRDLQLPCLVWAVVLCAVCNKVSVSL